MIKWTTIALKKIWDHPIGRIGIFTGVSLTVTRIQAFVKCWKSKRAIERALGEKCDWPYGCP